MGPNNRRLVSGREANRSKSEQSTVHPILDLSILVAPLEATEQRNRTELNGTERNGTGRNREQNGGRELLIGDTTIVAKEIALLKADPLADFKTRSMMMMMMMMMFDIIIDH